VPDPRAVHAGEAALARYLPGRRSGPAATGCQAKDEHIGQRGGATATTTPYPHDPHTSSCRTEATRLVSARRLLRRPERASTL